MKNQTIINQYFSTHWKSANFNSYKYSGFELIHKILPNETVLDVGCGNNPFKGLIPNLLGIDPANEAADLVVSIEDFKTPHLFDVAFCLGSINFGDINDITKGINKVISCLHDDARIYWRCNPGRHDHKSQEFTEIPVYPWSFDDHEVLSHKFGFSVKELCWDTNNRIYAEWVR